MNESAILYNQQRHEKVTYKNTKTTANNQRENYKDQNRSTIFLHDSSAQSSAQCSPKHKGLNRFKTLNNFEPKYKTISPAERKFTEFCIDKVGQKKDLKTSWVCNKKKEPVIDDEKPTKEMTANERKLKTLYPDKSLVEIEKLKKKATDLEEIPEKNYERAKSTRQKKVENMQSNIFNDPDKNKLKGAYEKTQEQLDIQKDEKKSQALPLKKLVKTRTAATFDWKTSNSELLFKGYKHTNMTAKEKKMKNLKSCFDSEKSVVEVENNILKTDINENYETEVKENISDQNILNKTNQTFSVLHDKEFYKRSLGNKNPEKEIQLYEISNVNYDFFNIKEFQKAYSAKGIHVYDVNMKGNYGNGNDKGVMSFKIRKNEDIQAFNEKVNEINNKLTNDMKIEFRIKNQNTRKPITENIPTTVTWCNSKLQSYAQHRNLDKSIQIEAKNKLDVNEKFASNKNLYDSTYKNTMLNKTFFKKMFKK